MLGVEILALSILSIKATPEMAKALQADAREKLLQKADEAIYARRNTAVELERQIKENELNTEIAVRAEAAASSGNQTGSGYRSGAGAVRTGGPPRRERA